MKKVFSLFASLVLAVTMFAAEGDIVGRIAGELTGGTPMITNGLNVNSNRGGFAVKEDGVFFCNGATGHMLKAPLDLSAAPVAENDSIGTGFYMDFDDAGHIVIYAWTVGSATMDVAQVYDADYNLLRNDTLLLNGRCDMPTLAGNVVEGRGAYFTASNSAKAVLRHNLVDGVLTSIDTIPSPVAHGGNSSVAPLDVDHFYVQSRGNALYYVDMSGDAPVVTNMPFFGENTFTSAYGGKAFKLAGHTLYVMGTYKVGGYLGSFAVFDVTDPANPYQIADEASTMGTSAMGTACVTFRVVMGDQVAHIYEYACYAVREYDLTVSSATFIKQNVEGEEWQAMKSDNGMLVLNNQIYKGADIMMNSAAENEGARTFAAADIIFDGTVVAKDTIDFIYDPVIDSLTIHLVGTFVPCIDFAVTVPEGTPNCYIAGNFNNWGFTRMVKLDDTHYKYKYVGTAALTENVQYKYTCGEDWAYVEKNSDGSEMSNRSWAEADVVATWASIPVINEVTYELNGGVTNDYGWKTKGEVLLDLQNDINADLSKSYTWAKMEDGIVYYNLNGTWTKETAAEGTACTVTGFVQNTTYNTTDMLKTYISVTKAEKYGWLKDVIVAARTAAGLAATDEDLSENIYRKEVSAFFLNSPSEPAWPVSAGYEAMGTLDAFQPIWKHGFANPTTVTDPFVLNRPYYAGMTFDGWYAEADFSGEKVTSIDANTSGTLYAKWVEYIPTLAEVIAMADNTDTNAKGVVTYVNGKNAYIQDASAGMLLYLKNNPSADFVVGKEVVVKGTRTTYGGAPEIKNVEEVRAENGTMPKAVSLATLAAATADPLKYFGQLIAFKGLTIVALDSYKNPSLTDGVDTVACYKMSVDDALFPVGTKVDVTAIAGYYNGFQLVGDPAGIVEAGGAGKDSYAYAAYGENGEYTLTNKWIYSNIQDNFASNMPAPADHARGMVAKDGKMYFINRQNGSFTVVNGATGKMLDPIVITGEHLFQTEVVTDSATGAKEWKDCATLKFNDVKLDQAGHFLIGGCVSGGNRFQIYKVDIATGAATVVVDDRLYDYPDFELEGKATAWRFDAFNVYGDVDSKAIIMAADANSFYVYKWEITNGVAGAAEQIDCEPLETDESLLVKDGVLSATAFGTAPQIFPVDFNYFYVDGWNTLPMLYDMDGTLVEDFATVPTGVQVGMPGDTCVMNTGHNGLCEFQVGDEYYLVMAATNTVGSPTSAFALYKFADENKEFSEMTPMWFFPVEGMGAATNGCRTAVPSVEVDQEKAVATLYVYTNNNGYGVYEMTGVKGGDAVVNVNSDNTIKAIKRIENGNLYIIRNGVRYNAQGVVAE